MEIERRFLVKDIAKVEELIDKYKDSRKAIVQDYIYTDMFSAIRKRKIEKNGNVKYIYTIKSGDRGISVNEIERQLTEDEFNELKKDDSKITIDKERYCIPYIDGLIIELDVFHGVYEGIVFAEIEFESEEQANRISIPEWFGVELTGKVTNARMTNEVVNFDELEN